jgi:predicted DNA-binding protein (UPF0278 family)
LEALERCGDRNRVMNQYNKIVVDTVCFSKGDIEGELGKIIRNDICEAAQRYINILNKVKIDTHTVVHRKKPQKQEFADWLESVGTRVGLGSFNIKPFFEFGYMAI